MSGKPGVFSLGVEENLTHCTLTHFLSGDNGGRVSFLNQLKSSSMVHLVSSEIKSILEHAMGFTGLENLYFV